MIAQAKRPAVLVPVLLLAILAVLPVALPDSSTSSPS
jgi:hypothetical protein